MGTPALSSFASRLAPVNPPLFNVPGSGAARTLLPQSPAPQQDLAALVQPNQALALSDAYENAVYRSLESRQSLSLQFSTLAAQAGEGGEGPAARAEAAQLTFNFFQESRYEEVALFNARTDATAEKLDGTRKASFFAARREISVRFELSVTISGAALQGFAKTAEGASDSNELLDRLLELTQKLLGGSDDLLNDFFSRLDGGDGLFNAGYLQELFGGFMSGIYGALKGDIPSLPGLPMIGFDGKGGQGLQAAGVQLEFKFNFSMSVSVTEMDVQQADPIAFDLKYREVDMAAASGNRIAQIASFLRNDDTRSTAADALLNYIA